MDSRHVPDAPNGAAQRTGELETGAQFISVFICTTIFETLRRLRKTVTQIGNLPYRRLVIGGCSQRFGLSRSADCQSAIQQSSTLRCYENGCQTPRVFLLSFLFVDWIH